MFMQNRMPIDYILTVHRTNYDIAYGKGAFDVALNQPNNLFIMNLFATYGENKVRSFVKEVVNVSLFSRILR